MKARAESQSQKSKLAGRSRITMLRIELTTDSSFLKLAFSQNNAFWLS